MLVINPIVYTSRHYGTFFIRIEVAMDKSSEKPANDQSDKAVKKERRRKICEQMEFYFSDSNLSKDRFLKQEISANSDGCKWRVF